MVWAATAVAVVGAYETDQNRKDAHAQFDANGRRIDAQMAQNRADMAPYTNAGKDANAQLMAQLGLDKQGNTPLFDVTQLPGYQQALKQGMAGVNQGAASAGMLMSGERLKGLQSTGQNIFGSYYSDYMNRLDTITNRGANAASGNVSANSGLASDLYKGQNDATAFDYAAKQGSINSWMGVANSGLGAWNSRTPSVNATNYNPSSIGATTPGNQSYQTAPFGGSGSTGASPQGSTFDYNNWKTWGGG